MVYLHLIHMSMVAFAIGSRLLFVYPNGVGHPELLLPYRNWCIIHDYDFDVDTIDELFEPRAQPPLPYVTAPFDFVAPILVFERYHNEPTPGLESPRWDFGPSDALNPMPAVSIDLNQHPARLLSWIIIVLGATPSNLQAVLQNLQLATAPYLKEPLILSVVSSLVSVLCLSGRRLFRTLKQYAPHRPSFQISSPRAALHALVVRWKKDFKTYQLALEWAIAIILAVVVAFVLYPSASPTSSTSLALTGFHVKSTPTTATSLQPGITNYLLCCAALFASGCISAPILLRRRAHPKVQDPVPLEHLITEEKLDQGADGAVSRARGRKVRSGLHVGRFKFGKKLGQGADGVVFQARDRISGSILAIKTMVKGDKITNRELRVERRALEIVQGKGIVEMRGHFENDSHIFLLLKYYPHGTLDKHISDLEGGIIRIIMSELVSSVDFVHRAGVIHRDIKPENILIDEHGHAILGDFGHSKIFFPTMEPSARAAALSHESSLLRCYGHYGTSFYMAPELWECEEIPYNFAVDWWSLGVTFHSIFTGQNFMSDMPFFKLRSPSPRCPITNFAFIEEEHVLLCGLCKWDVSARFDAAACKKEAFFSGIDWDSLEQRNAQQT